jgi:hypothetical protein
LRESTKFEGRIGSDSPYTVRSLLLAVSSKRLILAFVSDIIRNSNTFLRNFVIELGGETVAKASKYVAEDESENDHRFHFPVLPLSPFSISFANTDFSSCHGTGWSHSRGLRKP